ncbi:MinD/ParA family protein [Mesobacillus zeae]|uniref:MinD/ParA family protein n=1 Tax=Mesobacillus zeae TaxID=1917180 RepID=A0A398BJU0_9BACI|nr:MinD/ParA family protein [Mesobacillus zeae]RID88010.1 MinD/ParA family protein [Mesobacillus zeae]
MDQAERLRSRLKEQDSLKSAKTIAVVSGKGGVGKSNFSLNFSISLAKKGHRVLLFDLDIGMGNIEILLGSSSPLSFADYLTGNASLFDLIVPSETGIDYISGGTGFSRIISMDSASASRFVGDLGKVLDGYDFAIFDMGAGMSEQYLAIILAVNEIIAITAPEPTAMMDAYAAIKYIHHSNSEMLFHLVVNRVRSQREGEETLGRIEQVLLRFLGKQPVKLGMLPDDPLVPQAVKRQVPFSVLYPKAPASRALKLMVSRYETSSNNYEDRKETGGFASRLKRFLFEREGSAWTK